jgi:prevent-host-death family protein
MAQQDVEIGAFDAKTKLSELLRETERGRSFVISRRGKPVARLVPADLPADETDWHRLNDAFQQIRRGISGTVNVCDLIDQGRRF